MFGPMLRQLLIIDLHKQATGALSARANALVNYVRPEPTNYNDRRDAEQFAVMLPPSNQRSIFQAIAARMRARRGQ
jgi:hypothetical protein